jgi:hypothetical protein
MDIRKRDYTQRQIIRHPTWQRLVPFKARDLRRSGLTPWTVVPPKKMYALNQTNIERVETLLTYQWRHMNYRALLVERWRGGK